MSFVEPFAHNSYNRTYVELKWHNQTTYDESICAIIVLM